MSRDPARWITGVVVLAVLAAVVAQTLAALGVTGAFGWRVAPVMLPVPLAYRTVDLALDRRDAVQPLGGVRDPFEFWHAPPEPTAARLRPRSIAVVASAAPVLTAIVWDNDPRALVRWKGREWTLREGGLFDVFQVVSITRDQVLLVRGDESLVLRRDKPGE